MKVLLVCAGGMSTSILMKKLESYAAANDIDFEIAAVGLSAYKDIAQDYDCILVGPQVGYQSDIIAKESGLNVEVIPPQDYGLARCENIFKLIDKTLAK
ncbi:phosphotransferase system lactose/cellobiose-specific IIB subunit [Coriobacterium glomerans PW2]|uniref:Phosphotransferase system lactose/cellobiose-specific IIB subunit n=1 Tax=Coriobacterium glomerans (strain ATCC 49209 / DSM 20642 / JCM 10262 / PW2) TaxID=700015 RepID=F2NAZ3_CORGP|nr:PTS sugar transporter subunit IIB [Coriobacterium glomerans]AEB07671.1 phosphotransferase system lactose/cellobiose-specific IIB subunit [Coriobacterium glomerans PW2]